MVSPIRFGATRLFTGRLEPRNVMIVYKENAKTTDRWPPVVSGRRDSRSEILRPVGRRRDTVSRLPLLWTPRCTTENNEEKPSLWQWKCIQSSRSLSVDTDRVISVIQIRRTSSSRRLSPRFIWLVLCHLFSYTHWDFGNSLIFLFSSFVFYTFFFVPVIFSVEFLHSSLVSITGELFIFLWFECFVWEYNLLFCFKFIYMWNVVFVYCTLLFF